MQFTDHLDKIQELGFTIEIGWNRCFIISYENDDWGTNLHQPFGFKILHCSYFLRDDLTFEELIECCCDYFYGWYNRNLSNLKEYEFNNSDDVYDKLVDSILGDITKQIYRDNMIDSIFE